MLILLNRYNLSAAGLFDVDLTWYFNSAVYYVVEGFKQELKPYEDVVNIFLEKRKKFSRNDY